MALQSQNQAQPKAMPKAKVAAQPPVPISGDNNQEEAEGGGVPPVPPFPPFLPGLGAFSPVYPPGHGQLQEQFLRQCRFCKQVAYWREGVCVNEWCRVTWLQLVECPVCFVSFKHVLFSQDRLLQLQRGPQQGQELGRSRGLRRGPAGAHLQEEDQQGFLGWCRRCMFFPKVVNETGVNMLLLS